MAEQEGQPIPNNMDDPEMIMLWPVDEFMPILLALGFGMLVGDTLIALVAGVLIFRVYRRVKRTRADGFFLHQMYWWGLVNVKAPTGLSPFKQFFRA